jgi:hypothetical protein
LARFDKRFGQGVKIGPINRADSARFFLFDEGVKKADALGVG